MAEPWLVFYDSLCPVCRRSRRMLERLDWRRRLEFIDVHDRPRAEAALPHVSYADMLRQMYVRRPDGRDFAGFEALRALAAVLPPLMPLLPFLWLPGMKWPGGALYRTVARNRFRFAKCDTEICSLHLKLLAGRAVDDEVIAQVIALHQRHGAVAPVADGVQSNHGDA